MRKIVEQKHKTLNKFIVPLISFAIFIVPLVMDAVQIDFETKTNLAVQWQLVMSAVFSGGVATILTLFKRLYETYRIDYDKEIADLKNEVKILAISRDLDEKQIMLTSAQLNDEWLSKNATIEQCENLLVILKAKTEKVKDQQVILEQATNGLTEAIELVDVELLEKQREIEKLDEEIEKID